MNNVMVVLGGQQRDSVRHIHVSILPQRAFAGTLSTDLTLHAEADNVS